LPTNEPALSIPVTAAVHPWRGYFLIAAATLCWGAAATFGKAVFNGTVVAGPSPISPLVLSQTRTTFAFLLLAPFLLLRYGRKFFTVSRRDLGLCALVGTLGLTGSNFFYYLAVQKGTVAVAIILQYTAPVWVLLYMVLRGRQKATLQRVSAVCWLLFHSRFTTLLLKDSFPATTR
jgi:drug/metabolite transporter (DMT)-like permease